MRGQLNVTATEKSLGFKRTGRMSIEARLSLGPEMNAFLRDLEALKSEFVKYSRHELGTCPRFRERCEALFEAHGSHLWPLHDIDRSYWLVDASIDDRDGLYPRDLYYCNISNQEM